MSVINLMISGALLFALNYSPIPMVIRPGFVQSLKEATLTLAYSPYKQLDFRAETRHDLSNVVSILNKNGVGGK